MNYRPVIGLETHIQLNTKTKLYCSCLNEYSPDEPNKNICEFCTGQPGALPVLNREAVKKAIRLGVALGSTIPEITHWDRKNYFYPDNPNGYQISQSSEPIIQGGKLNFYSENKQTGQFTPASVTITEAHLENDAAKLIHAGGKTMVDFNRSGAPLIEIVTDPVLHSKEDAMAYVTELQLLARKIDISHADMEKGQMRFDCNISLQTEDQVAKNELPSFRAEIKNINSVRALGRAIEYEIERQTKLLDEGKVPAQETRGWDDDKGISISQRSKENAHDYRYFPEPDLFPLKIEKSDIPDLSELPELPNVQRRRYIDLGLPVQLANTFVTQDLVGKYFDQTVAVLFDKNQPLIKAVANIISVNLLAKLDEQTKMEDLLSCSNLIELAKMFESGTLNNQGLATAIEHLVTHPQLDANHVVKELSLAQVNDDSALEAFVELVIKNNPTPVDQLRSGKEQVIGFLVGQCMRESKGKGNPQKFTEILKQKILG